MQTKKSWPNKYLSKELSGGGHRCCKDPEVGPNLACHLCWECRRCGQEKGNWGLDAVGPPLPGTELVSFWT